MATSPQDTRTAFPTHPQSVLAQTLFRPNLPSLVQPVRLLFPMIRWFTVQRSIRSLSLALALLLTALFVPQSAQAQSRTTSAVRGQVMSTDGTLLSGVQVEIRHQDTGATRSVLTNGQGNYLVLLLQPGGPYTIRITSLGMAPFEREGLILQVGEVTTIDATMSTQAVDIAGVNVEVRRDEIFNPQQVGPATLLSE